jgi:hypothetical protein
MCDETIQADRGQMMQYAVKLDVKRVSYSVKRYCEHAKALVVTYQCEEGQTLEEYYLFGAQNPRAAVAREWWRERAGTQPPATPQEAFKRRNQLRAPTAIIARFVGELESVTPSDDETALAKAA